MAVTKVLSLANVQQNELDQKTQILHQCSQLRDRSSVDGMLHIVPKSVDVEPKLSLEKVADAINEIASRVDKILATSWVLFGDACLNPATITFVLNSHLFRHILLQDLFVLSSHNSFILLSFFFLSLLQDFLQTKSLIRF